MDLGQVLIQNPTLKQIETNKITNGSNESFEWQPAPFEIHFVE